MDPREQIFVERASEQDLGSEAPRIGLANKASKYHHEVDVMDRDLYHHRAHV